MPRAKAVRDTAGGPRVSAPATRYPSPPRTPSHGLTGRARPPRRRTALLPALGLSPSECSLRLCVCSMARGPKRHLKRLNAPKHWMLDKLGGIWAPRPSTGPHKLRECLPLIVLLRNRLKYALNTKEVKYILMQRLIKVDGKARTDKTYPAGFMGEPVALAPPLC